MPIQTIRYSVTGANPANSSIQVSFDTSGNGTGTITLAGTNSGVDTLQAFFDAFGLSSNQAQVVWQGANGAISISPILCYQKNNPSNAALVAGLSISDFASPQTFNSLMFNTHPQSLLPGDPHQSGNQANPMVNNAITANGQYSGDVAIIGDDGGGMLLAMTGSFVVAQAGQIAFTAYDNQGFVIACPGASYVSGVNSSDPGAGYPTITTTPIQGYPVLAGRNGNFPGGNTATDNFTLNFANPGVYPFEIYFAAGTSSEREFCLLANGAVIPPASIVAVPPAPAPGSGQMILTPNAAGPDITGNTQSFTISITGVVFQTEPYLPLLQGVAGYLLVSNDTGDNNFTFPTLPNGGTVNAQQALTACFSLSGDNDSWQNRLALALNGANVTLAYNGNAPDSNVATTNLTVSNEDIAYYNPTTQSFDTFGISNQGGGSQAEILVYWLVNPTVGSYSPNTLNGDGLTYQVTFIFAQSMPAIQNNVIAAVTVGTGLTFVSSSFIVENGWTVGLTVSVTAAVTSAAIDSQINITLTGDITYLSGTSFVTENYTYINNQAFDITIEAESTIILTGGAPRPGNVAGCPATVMYVQRHLPVEFIEVGDKLDCLTEDYVGIETHAVEAVSFERAKCIRLITANKAELIISESTPVPTIETIYAIKGGADPASLPVYASQIEPGMHLLTDIEGRLEVSEAVSVERVGTYRVGHVSVGGRNFAAGRDSRRRIYTHNIAPIEKL
jgi:hypothetical protein